MYEVIISLHHPEKLPRGMHMATITNYPLLRAALSALTPMTDLQLPHTFLLFTHCKDTVAVSIQFLSRYVCVRHASYFVCL